MTEQEKEKLVELAYKAVMGQDLRPQDRRVVVNTCQRFLAAIDAERSKDAVAWQFNEGGEWYHFMNEKHRLDTIAAGYSVRALYLTPRVVPEWQPIETAPKDGSSILLMGSSGRVADGLWMTANTSVGAWLWPYVKAEPTHWMPLPSSPEDV